MSLMFPQLSSFFADLKLGLMSSVGGPNAGSRRGSYRTAADTVTTSSMDDLDESQPAPSYSCLGSRSASMECGLSAVGQRRRRRRFRKPKLCSAESLDRLSDRVYRYSLEPREIRVVYTQNDCIVLCMMRVCCDKTAEAMIKQMFCSKCAGVHRS